MDQPECGTNTPYLIDFIKITLSAKLANPQEIRSLYVDQGFSAGQIANKLRISKSVVLARLKDLGVRSNEMPNRNTNPDNYRCSVAPFGFMVKNAKLVPNKNELKVCHAIVELIERKGFTCRAAARELQSRGLKNRAGHAKWGHSKVAAIYRKWKGKI